VIDEEERQRFTDVREELMPFEDLMDDWLTVTAPVPSPRRCGFSRALS
jgi:hypothetical protein